MVERSSRTPLTRQNLEAAENRCKELENLLAKSRPDLLRSRTTDDSNLPTATPKLVARQDGNPQKPPEDRPALASGEKDSYDWQEDLTLQDERQESNSQDDIVTSQRNTGYYGPTSASTLLDSLSTVLSPTGNATSPATVNIGGSAADIPRHESIQPGLIYSHGITSILIHERFIDNYFRGFNSSYPILHERSFRARLQKSHQHPAHSIFRVIYYVVIALGEWIAGAAPENHSVYYDAVRSHLKFEILETGNISVVQAFLLLGNYLQKRDRPNTAYNFIGIAYRVALGLGLHREPEVVSASKQRLVQQRRQIFWTLYCFESGFSLTTGRPASGSDTFINIKKPKNIDDSTVGSTVSETREVDYPTTSSAIIAQARLAVIANKIHNNILSTHSHHDLDDLPITMEQSISNWRSSLPVYFFHHDVPQWFLGPRQIVLWKEANLRIILLLASQRRAREEEDRAVLGARCQSVAVNTISDIAEFCKTNVDLIHVGINWYAVYFLLHALLSLAYQMSRERNGNHHRIMIQETESAPAAWERTTSLARQCLELLSNGNKAAKRTLQLLDRLQARFASPVQATNVPLANFQGGDTGCQNDRYRSIGPETSQSAARDFANRYVPQPSMPSGVSPDVPLTDTLMDEWFEMADPSLHMYFSGETAGLDAVFSGFEGFPSMMEPENFAYITNMAPTSIGTPSGVTDRGRSHPAT